MQKPQVAKIKLTNPPSVLAELSMSTSVLYSIDPLNIIVAKAYLISSTNSLTFPKD